MIDDKLKKLINAVVAKLTTKKDNTKLPTTFEEYDASLWVVELPELLELPEPPEVLEAFQIPDVRT